MVIKWPALRGYQILLISLIKKVTSYAGTAISQSQKGEGIIALTDAWKISIEIILGSL